MQQHEVQKIRESTRQNGTLSIIYLTQKAQILRVNKIWAAHLLGSYNRANVTGSSVQETHECPSYFLLRFGSELSMIHLGYELFASREVHVKHNVKEVKLNAGQRRKST